MLNIKNLSKTYHSLNGEIQSIENVSFNINEKEFISIIGPSGSGKSTLLNIISDLDKNYKGSIETTSNVSIGYMFQSDALFEWLTVLENTLIGLDISKKINTNSKTRVINLLKKYGLYEFKDKYPSSLSGGMKQRVALIRTLATNPDLLLLDEPFSSLDYQSRLKVSDDVYKIIKEEGKTVLMVTHDIAEAISMSDKVIVLSKRPSVVKNIHNIELINKSTPIENRKDTRFSYYYDLLWKEIDGYE